MKIAHLFEIRDKSSEVPNGQLEKYQEATQELIKRLRAKSYMILIERTSYSKRGVPDSILIGTNNLQIAPVAIKDHFREIVREIRIEMNLGFKLWDFTTGEIYQLAE